MEAAELAAFATSVAGVTARYWARRPTRTGRRGRRDCPPCGRRARPRAGSPLARRTRSTRRWPRPGNSAGWPARCRWSTVRRRPRPAAGKRRSPGSSRRARCASWWRSRATPTKSATSTPGTAATHVLTLPPGTAGTAGLRPITACRPLPGLAVPAWSAVTLGAAPKQRGRALTAARTAEHVTAAPARPGRPRAGRGERAHEMAIEHAKTRRQFGQLIGSFGAVQQRAAACQIDVSAGRQLLGRAAAAYASGRADWPLQAEIAVEFIAAGRAPGPVRRAPHAGRDRLLRRA